MVGIPRDCDKTGSLKKYAVIIYKLKVSLLRILPYVQQCVCRNINNSQKMALGIVYSYQDCLKSITLLITMPKPNRDVWLNRIPGDRLSVTFFSDNSEFSDGADFGLYWRNLNLTIAVYCIYCPNSNVLL